MLFCLRKTFASSLKLSKNAFAFNAVGHFKKRSKNERFSGLVLSLGKC